MVVPIEREKNPKICFKNHVDLQTIAGAKLSEWVTLHRCAKYISGEIENTLSTPSPSGGGAQNSVQKQTDPGTLQAYERMAGKKVKTRSLIAEAWEGNDAWAGAKRFRGRRMKWWMGSQRAGLARGGMGRCSTRISHCDCGLPKVGQFAGVAFWVDRELKKV